MRTIRTLNKAFPNDSKLKQHLLDAWELGKQLQGREELTANKEISKDRETALKELLETLLKLKEDEDDVPDHKAKRDEKLKVKMAWWTALEGHLDLNKKYFTGSSWFERIDEFCKDVKEWGTHIELHHQTSYGDITKANIFIDELVAYIKKELKIK